MSNDLASHQFGVPMIYQSNQFDFGGRSYRFHHVSLTHDSETAVLRAIATAMEPAVVEARDEQHAVFHLVADDEPGGTYVRDPSRTRTLARVDEAELLAWFDDLTRRGERPLEELSIADGWFVVDAQPGDVLRQHVGRSKADLGIVDRHERHVVRGPNPSVLVAPFVIRLLSQTSRLEIAVHWSAWTDSDGVGHARFQQLLGALAACGWTPEMQPTPEDLGWHRP